MTSLRISVFFVSLMLAASIEATICSADRKPAATLLFPYAIADLESDNFPLTTVLSVRNHDSTPQLANVTLWSNVGVAVFSFPVYLAGHDTVRINTRNMLRDASTPLTGPGFSSDTALSEPQKNFPNCSVTKPPSVSALDANLAEEVRAALLGSPSTVLGGNCAAISSGSSIAEFYVTVDTISECDAADPSESSYYSGQLAFDNVLTGYFEVIDPANNFAQSGAAVHIEAAEGFFQNGDATFYGKLAGSAAGQREPLPTTFSMSVRQNESGNRFSEALVWREPRSNTVDGFSCGLAQIQDLGFSGTLNDAVGESSPFAFVNTHGSVIAAGSSLQDFEEPRYAINRVEIALGEIYNDNAGQVIMNLQNDNDSPATFGQAWVMNRSSDAGRFSGAAPATPLDDNCPSGAFTFIVRSGPQTSLPAVDPLFRDRLETIPSWSDDL